MLSSIKQQVVVGRNGKIEIQTSDLAVFNKMKQSICRLLKLIVNLMAAIQNIQTKTNLVSFTHEEWNEEYNITRK
ncbi:hypothetical protein [Planktothrix agardhii]|uniref:hypothetical protein n=1 Tax=Planktothrix agardhii TaxID=1160 RepID=UPI001F2AA8B9|nr:hypothetical protein [Planktothrix agardhii]MCF3577368.1 hypothetical protein [Planktothrix agardhii 1812]